ncbi:unnamed protein product [Diabrotica balteata]|uniref:Calcium release-activated calcium channel protein 1 n=1 Tax=Diabrotica balteata TaxID=107213 RepID=A0A9P0E456_DIABA|nr:unnamed protein product [Diabrotica balteata]
MDQSTQVNFPIVTKFDKRKIWRHNTSTDLFTSMPNRAMSSSNLWAPVKPSRPRSLNVTSDTINRTKISYLDHSMSLQPHSLETSFGSISRERTPPFSSNSSLTSNGPSSSIVNGTPSAFPTSPSSGFASNPASTGYTLYKSRPRVKIRDDESTASGPKTYCRCYDIEHSMTNEKRQLTNTSDGLSWRRLHMSRAKLKATATTSELLSGFAMIAMVELQINTPTNVPEWLFVLFAVCTTVLVAVHIFALMISTYILPNIEAIAKLEVCEMVKESPHERMKGFIEIAWAFSTILGLFLFLIEIAILCWVKFWDYSFSAAVAATVIVIPVLIIFVLFAAHFYHSLVVYKCNTSNSDMEKLENIKKQLDEVTISM